MSVKKEAKKPMPNTTAKDKSIRTGIFFIIFVYLIQQNKRIIPGKTKKALLCDSITFIIPRKNGMEL